MTKNIEIFNKIVNFIRDRFGEKEAFIPLHEPCFCGKEKDYVLDAIESTFVSSVGRYVDQLEELLVRITDAKYAIATGTGTSALHVALMLAGVERGTEVITQALSFVATTNVICYVNAEPVFVDVERETLGMSPDALCEFLEKHAAVQDNGECFNKVTGRRIAACMPMHTFGFPCDIAEIRNTCDKYRIPLVEDSAESIGSSVEGHHTGTFGLMGILSFNGNKTVTCGGGGAIVTDNEELAKKAKHITTTAKVQHKWEYRHDEVGYNYRMPNLNAALACAQLEQLDAILKSKRALAAEYEEYFRIEQIPFVKERSGTIANYWLNTILLEDRVERDAFLAFTNDQKIMTRPAWTPLNELPMYEKCQAGPLINTSWLADRLVNIPSSPRL